ncbi:MAG TPA: hypothetical protein VFW65_00440 [Pseudonocardiaceae bacterium]|nr:hypothetical protein [Pseudonocardiaceae bacterium]
MNSTAPIAEASASAELSADVADLFDLDPRTAPIVTLPTGNDSADCTNDGCTKSCVSCGCR